MKQQAPRQVPPALTGQRKKLRRRLMMFWVLMTLSAFCVILVLLSAAGMFTNADNQLNQGLRVYTETAAFNIQENMDQLTARSIGLSEEVSREVENLLVKKGISFQELNNDPESLQELQERLYAPIHTLLRSTRCSGAYAVLDVTANTETKTAESSRSGIYLKCVNLSGGDTSRADISYFRGVPEVAREKAVELHNRWNLEFNVSRLPGYEKMLSQKLSRPAEYYFWTEKVDLEDTWEEAIFLCVPVVGKDHSIYGVCGVEISSMFFRLTAPVRETEYGSVITAMAPIENGKLMLDKGVVGAVDGNYQGSCSSLSIHQGKHYHTYIGESSWYVGEQEIIPISNEKEQRQWAVAMLLSGEQYEAYYHRSGQKLMFSCLGVLMVLLAVSGLLYWKLVNPADKKAQQMSENEGSAEEDIQHLLDFIRSEFSPELLQENFLPRDVEKIMDRFFIRATQLESSERRIFHLLAEGCDPKGIGAKTGLSQRNVRRRMKKLCEGLEVSSVEDILLYLDLFRRCGRQEEIRRI